MSRLGTRQSHATVSLLIFVVLLLFKLGHQAEFATAAAFRIIQHLVLQEQKGKIKHTIINCLQRTKSNKHCQAQLHDLVRKEKKIISSF